MFCRNVTLTLFKWAKRELSAVFIYDATGTLKNRFKPYSARAFFRASKDWGRPVVSARFEHK